MSATIKEIVLKAINTLLNDTVVVSTLTVPYYADGFGNSDYGIFLQSYQAEDDSNKHTWSNRVTMDFEIFGIGKTSDFVSEATRKVMILLKASVASTIQLSDGYQATYTTMPSVSSFSEMQDGTITHRDVLRLVVRVDETE